MNLAVLAATLVDVVDFFPVTFLYGVSKFLFSSLALAFDDCNTAVLRPLPARSLTSLGIIAWRKPSANPECLMGQPLQYLV